MIPQGYPLDILLTILGADDVTVPVIGWVLASGPDNPDELNRCRPIVIMPDDPYGAWVVPNDGASVTWSAVR